MDTLLRGNEWESCTVEPATMLRKNPNESYPHRGSLKLEKEEMGSLPDHREQRKNLQALQLKNAARYTPAYSLLVAAGGVKKNILAGGTEEHHVCFHFTAPPAQQAVNQLTPGREQGPRRPNTAPLNILELQSVDEKLKSAETKLAFLLCALLTAQSREQEDPHDLIHLCYENLAFDI
ncbi:hypothetical protein CRENBAI_004507 [Crenichthys baileyi]|uniref:Uncharacterized protein n=1 Tax=Crenichthys baileyi TaxID=28760 RepID=A0AAV9RCA5_9TELE